MDDYRLAWNLGYRHRREMLQDLTARELRTIRIIQSKELIGNDRRDMLLAKGIAGIMRSSGCPAGYQELVRELFPLDIPVQEQTPDEMFAVLESLSHVPKHSDTGG